MNEANIRRLAALSRQTSGLVCLGLLVASPAMLDLVPGRSMNVIRASVRQLRRRKPPRGSRWAALVSCGLLLPGCKGGSTETDRRAAPGDASEHEVASARRIVRPSEAEVELRREMFERLVGEIRQSHVFSSAWPEAEWARHLPALWQEVSNATSRVSLWRALRHLSNSLRDGHLRFSPAGTDELRDRVRLPFELVNAGTSTRPRLMVWRSERTREIAPGDELLTYDGVSSAQLLEHFQFELNGSTPGARLDQLLNFLQSRAHMSSSKPGQPSVCIEPPASPSPPI